MTGRRRSRLRLWHPIAALALAAWTLVAVVVLIVWHVVASIAAAF